MTAGLLCLFGFINLVPGVYDLVRSTTDGQDWSGDSDIYPPVVMHLAALAQVSANYSRDLPILRYCCDIATAAVQPEIELRTMLCINK